MAGGSPASEEPSPLEAGDSGTNSRTSSNISTASIRGSIYNYEERYGRTYHAYGRGQYSFPNDEGELDRMDIHYHSLRLLMRDRHWLCPIESPTCILDIGTGTGIWAMDVADDHENASVIGTDLSAVQPVNVSDGRGYALFPFTEFRQIPK